MFFDRIKKISRLPLFLYLLPLFFVLHGFTEGYYLVTVTDSFFLLLKYLSTIFILHIIFFFLFRNNYRATLFLFVLLLIYFFFGAFHDAIKSILPGSFFVKYSFILPFIFLVISIAFIIVRRIKTFIKPSVYLNVLFFVLIFIEIFLLSQKIPKYDRQHQLKSLSSEFILCDTCNKPDIYLIMLDEYAGEKTLQDLYSFDNTTFLKQLEKRKFQVIKNSFSNYNLTPISIASLLNINYMEYKGKELSYIAMKPFYNRIDTNILVPFLRFHSYDFINNSIFPVYGQPPLGSQPFTPLNTRIIASQTFLNRLIRDLGDNLKKWGIVKNSNQDDYKVLNNNNKILKNIKEQVLRKSKKPVFSFSHLTMPHYPYYFNSLGQPYPPSSLEKGTQWLENNYLEYLLYVNGVIIELIDFILQHSRKPPVIILTSDHGFRHYSKEVHEEYNFYNLNATFLPDQYIRQFKDNMSNLSYMRSLLNLLFDQNLAVDKQERFYIPIPAQ